MSGSQAIWTRSLLLTAAILLWASWPLILWSAAEEPFFGRPGVRDGFINVGLGSIFALCWLIWSAINVAAVARRKTHVAMLLTLLVPLYTVWMLQIVVVGYMEDVGKAYDMAASVTANE